MVLKFSNGHKPKTFCTCRPNCSLKVVRNIYCKLSRGVWNAFFFNSGIWLYSLAAPWASDTQHSNQCQNCKCVRSRAEHCSGVRNVVNSLYGMCVNFTAGECSVLSVVLTNSSEFNSRQIGKNSVAGPNRLIVENYQLPTLCFSLNLYQFGLKTDFFQVLKDCLFSSGFSSHHRYRF